MCRHDDDATVNSCIAPQGLEALTIYSAKFDRKDCRAVTGGYGVVISISFQVIDAYSEFSSSLATAKWAMQGVATIGNQRKTLIMTLNTTNAQGAILSRREHLRKTVRHL